MKNLNTDWVRWTAEQNSLLYEFKRQIDTVDTPVQLANLYWFMWWFLADSCDTKRKISQSPITWFWFQFTCPRE